MLKTLGVQLRASMPVPCQRRLPEGLPHHYPSLAPTLSNPHYPLLCTNTLASLVKGRWIDGKAQTVVLLRFNCDTSAFFIHQTFLPSRRRDCYTTPSKTALSLSLFVGEWACPSRCIEPLHPNNFLKSTFIALPRTTKLASLVKGEVLSPERIRTTTGGIATPLSPRPTPTLPKTALSLENR